MLLILFIIPIISLLLIMSINSFSFLLNNTTQLHTLYRKF